MAEENKLEEAIKFFEGFKEQLKSLKEKVDDIGIRLKKVEDKND